MIIAKFKYRINRVMNNVEYIPVKKTNSSRNSFFFLESIVSQKISYKISYKIMLVTQTIIKF